MLKIRGVTVNTAKLQGSFMRRSVQLQNRIKSILQKGGAEADYTKISEQRNPLRAGTAHASWYMGEDYCFFSHSGQARYLENLHVVLQVVDHEVKLLLAGEHSRHDFVGIFKEDEKVLDLRKEARETLGVAEDCFSIDEIEKAYKKLAKAHHPDSPGGSVDKFKEANAAHKILMRELK
jgi:hypothetical protein